MSWHSYNKYIAKFLILFLITSVQFKAIFYKAGCEVIKSYNIETVTINVNYKKIILELTNGVTIIVPFDNGFKEFQITTGRGYERTYIYDGIRLVRTKEKICNNNI